MGEPTEARVSFVEALSHARSDAGTPAQKIRALVHLGLADKNLGDFEAALESHQEALALETKLHGKDHLLASRHHHNIGGVLRSMKRYEEALQHYQQALQTRSSALGEAHPTTLMTVNSLGLIELDQGRLAAAQRAFERAEAGLAEAGDLRRARALTNLGIVAQRRRRFDVARSHYDEARRLWVEAGGDSHPLAVELAETLERVKRQAKAPRAKPAEPEDDPPVSPVPSYGPSPSWSEK